MNAAARDGQREAIVVVLSGGSGARFGAQQPKQLTELGDRTILEHTLGTVAELESVRRVAIAANVSYVEQISTLAGSVLPPDRLTIANGGATRNRSVYNALAACGDVSGCDVLVHDAARPLATASLFEAVRSALRDHSCVVPVVDAVDPMFDLESGRITAVRPKRSLARGQSPQGFHGYLLWNALRRDAEADMDRETLFEAVLACYPNEQVFGVPGEDANIKVTLPLDAVIALELLRSGL